MGTASAAHKVLSNDDLLDIIFSSTPESISYARLVSRTFEASASPHLFRTLRLSALKRHLRRIKRVAADPKFAKGVRNIVWETVHYVKSGQLYDDLDVISMICLGGEALVKKHEKDSQEYTVSVARLRALARDEEELGDWVGLLKELVSAFRSFTGLRSLEITSWSSHKGKAFFNEDEILGRNGCMPPPLHTLTDLKHAFIIQNRGFRILLEALARADRYLDRLAVAATSDHALGGVGVPHIGFPGMLLDFDSMSEDCMRTLARPLAHLRNLHLDLDDKDLPCNKNLNIHRTIGNGGLSRFLAHLHGLQALDLRVHAAKTAYDAFHTVIVPLSKVFSNATFKQLRKLALADFWLEPEELCEVLSRHSSALEEVTLTNINLGGVADAPELISGTVRLMLPVFRPWRFTTPDIYMESEAVARACQTLPRLSGLAIEGPSVGVNWTALAVFDTEDLVECGMNGRPNAFMPASIVNIWGPLERPSEYDSEV